MAYCWLVHRSNGKGKAKGMYYLYFAKQLGRKPYSLNTRDRSLAREAQRRKESEIWKGEQGIKQRTPGRLRYKDLVERFKEAKYAAGLNVKTLSNYLKTLNQFGDFMQSDVFIDAITAEHLEAFITHRRKCPRQHGEGTLAPKSIRNDIFTLVGLFKWATNRDLLLENPMRKITKPRRVVYDAPRALTPEEFLKLKAVIKNQKFADIVDLYVLTGIRRSDGLKVTSENFDFERMIATLPQHKQGTTKMLPIGPDLANVVHRMIDRVGEGKPLVQLHPSRLTDNFRHARKDASLPASITFHSLRHTFASWLAALGTDFKTLQELIGHRSSEATEIYVHAFDPNKRSAIEKLMLPRKASNA